MRRPVVLTDGSPPTIYDVVSQSWAEIVTLVHMEWPYQRDSTDVDINLFSPLVQRIIALPRISELRLKICPLPDCDWHARTTVRPTVSLQLLKLTHLHEDLILSLVSLTPNIVTLSLINIVATEKTIVDLPATLYLPKLQTLIVEGHTHQTLAKNTNLPLFSFIARSCIGTLRSLSILVTCIGHLELKVPYNMDLFDLDSGQLVLLGHDERDREYARRAIRACPRLRHLQLLNFDFDDHSSTLSALARPLKSFGSKSRQEDGERWAIGQLLASGHTAVRRLRFMGLSLTHYNKYMRHERREGYDGRVKYVPYESIPSCIRGRVCQLDASLSFPAPEDQHEATFSTVTNI
ncbi:hypothetical protein BKA62DRAFT_720100 [Auriculariales sp. MPI-PUGE-AT-0066]|nr:hypothetical protein BKA62DRAFT_720100 [Auriculariales sp. MPI-PUGE-AT-0066]